VTASRATANTCGHNGPNGGVARNGGQTTTEVLEVELPGSGWVVADVDAQLVFTEEFEAEF
jgi:hypothetical protein